MNIKKSFYLIILFLYVFCTLSIIAQNSDEIIVTVPTVKPTPESDNDWMSKRRLETFQVVWKTINDNYFDQTFSGLDWNKIKLEYEPQIKKLETDEELHTLLQKMIARLERSHFSIIPPEVFVTIEQAKQQSANLSKDLTQEKSNEELTDDDVVVEDIDLSENDIYSKYGIGIELRYYKDKFLITQVEKGSSAQKNNIKPGYILDKINGVSMNEFLASIRQFSSDTKKYEQKFPLEVKEWFLNGPKGTLLEITVIDEKDEAKEIILKREKLSGNFVTVLNGVPEQYLRYESKSLNDQIGYIKFNIFALPLIEKFCGSISDFKDKKAIVIDLRGNYGGLFGALMGISGLLIDEPLKMGTEIYKNSQQNRVIQPHKKNFKGKIFILTDKVSFSAAEIFAASFQENGRATVVGETSAGEALPAMTKILPTGATFLFPVSNFKTPKGKVLEGNGVQPNFKVSLNRSALLQGRDDQLDAAIKIANSQIEKQKAKSNVAVKRKPPPPPAAPSRISTKRRRTIRKSQSSKALSIINKFIEASGGKEILENLISFKGTGSFEIDQAGAIIEGKSEIIWQSPNKYLERFIINGAGTISEIFDGKDYYVESEFTGSDDVISPRFVEDRALSMGFYEILKMRDLYPRISYKGIYTVDGKKSYLLEATSPKGLQVAFVFDTKTNLLLKRTSMISGNIEYQNYNAVEGGAILPFTIIRNTSVIFKLKEIKTNFAVDDSSFTRKVNCFDKVD